MQQTRTAVAGYVRVSTEQQADEGVSLDAQRTKLHAYAVAMDLDLVAVFEDAGSPPSRSRVRGSRPLSRCSRTARPRASSS